MGKVAHLSVYPWDRKAVSALQTLVFHVHCGLENSGKSHMIDVDSEPSVEYGVGEGQDVLNNASEYDCTLKVAML